MDSKSEGYEFDPRTTHKIKRYNMKKPYHLPAAITIAWCLYLSFSVLAKNGLSGSFNSIVVFGSIWLLGSWFNEAWNNTKLEKEFYDLENSLDQLEDLENLIAERKAELQVLNKKLTRC